MDDKIEKVKLTRALIETGFFGEEQITTICEWLGFNDTAFRNKSSKDKLEDYLLNEKYWLIREAERKAGE